MKSIKASVSERQPSGDDSSSVPQPIRWGFVLRKGLAWSIISFLVIWCAMLTLDALGTYGPDLMLRAAVPPVFIVLALGVLGLALWAIIEVMR
jgi:hypothetical protein